MITTLKNNSSGHGWSDDLDTDTAAILDTYFLAQYGDRHLNKYGQMFGSNADNMTKALVFLYGVKWDRLYTGYKAEYNPIWNVDGMTTETITRNLMQTHSGTDTIAASGTDTLKHTGTDITAESGTDTLKHTGTDTTAESGTDTTGNTGTSTVESSGTDTRALTNNTYGYNSAEAVPESSSEETVTKGTKDTTTNNLNTSTQYGRTDTNTKDLTDATQYGRTDTNTKDLTDATQYGRTDTNTKDLTDTDNGTITTETKRGGNIGVTMTQQMLEADLNYWTDVLSLFYKVLMQDIANEITYKICTD